METDRKQDPCCAAEKRSSLPGPGRARTQEGCPATWARFQEGVEASSKGRPEGGWNRRSQSWGGEAELRRERRVGLRPKRIYQHGGCSYQHWALVRL